MTSDDIPPSARCSTRFNLNMDLALHASAHHGALSSSPQVLQSILVDEASKCSGFVGMVDAHDFPNPAANDSVGSLTNTTPRYLMQVGDLVPCVGAHVAMVLADSAAHARYASKRVQLVFTPSIMDASAEVGASTRMSAHAFKASVEHLASRGNAPKMGLHVDLLDKATAASRAVERAHEGVGEPWSDEPHWRVVHGRPPTEWQAAAQAAAQVAARSAASGVRSKATTTATAPLVLNGTFATGGQKHFYLETQVESRPLPLMATDGHS